MHISIKRKLNVYMKTAFARVILFFLYRGMKVLYRYDTRMRREVDGWEMGQTIVLAASEEGPGLCMKRVSYGLARTKVVEKPDILITFKSPDGAFLVLSGQIGTAGAYAQHRFKVKGNIARVMSVVRCMDLAEAYLFPGFMTRRILRKVPDKQIGSIRVYLHAVIGM